MLMRSKFPKEGKSKFRTVVA